MSTRTGSRLRILFNLLLVIIFIFTISNNLWSSAYAQDILTDYQASKPVDTNPPLIEVINPYFSIEHKTMADGTPVSVYIINGPSTPPAEYKAERIASIKPITNAVAIPNFPSYNWVFGCAAVSGAMIAGYYDRTAYPEMYTGPMNGGIMPITDTSWPVWSDGYETYPNNPLIASHNGVDGRTTRGSIDDYWVSYMSTANDPYITNGWTQHIWGSAIGDYMKTSQSAAPYNNIDGGTKFYNFTNSGAKMTCSHIKDDGADTVDGTYGKKLFYEARGYQVNECYNQNTDNKFTGGFSLANFKAEIDSGHPVQLNLTGHSIVGYGYSGSTIYIRDTWDNNPDHTYTMPWGGSYQQMELLSVSVVHLTPPPTTKLVMSLLVRPANINKSPTNILLSNSSIEENLPVNTQVGTLSTIDPNAGDTFIYSLVSGAGDTGNGSFNILGNKLRSSEVFDYETQNSYSIRLRTTDHGGLFFEKVFNITITLVTEEPILNGDFEQGPVGWTEFSTHGWPLITQDFPDPVTPYDGFWAVWLGGDYDEIAYIQQQVVVPANNPYLSYWHWIASEEYCGGYDIGVVSVNGTVVDSYYLCIDNDTGGWVERVVNLSAYTGASVTLEIRAECDGTNNSNLFIDHVAFQSSPRNSNPPSMPVIDIDSTAVKPAILK